MKLQKWKKIVHTLNKMTRRNYKNVPWCMYIHYKILLVDKLKLMSVKCCKGAIIKKDVKTLWYNDWINLNKDYNIISTILK